ncbi:MAG: tetratricopeptide repeat protein, partial [Bacteroidia bacterium]|nr:tetratricopeptide repeat protein [Bacteroidia bacterium]
MKKKFEDIQNSDFPYVEPEMFQEWKKVGLSYRKNKKIKRIILIISFIPLFILFLKIIPEETYGGWRYFLAAFWALAAGLIIVSFYADKYFKFSEKLGIDEDNVYRILEGMKAKEEEEIGGGKKIDKEEISELKKKIEDCNKAIEINPDNAETYFSRAAAKEMLGDKSGAIADYSKFIEFNPDIKETYSHRGDLRYKLGDYKGAIEDYDKLLEGDSSD